MVDLLHRQRDDIAVPSDLLDDAAAALLANGWKVSPTKLPLPHTPDRCRSGWDIVAKYSRLFRYPESYNGTRPHELLVLPASFVGFEHQSLHDSSKFSRFGRRTLVERKYSAKSNSVMPLSLGYKLLLMTEANTTQPTHGPPMVAQTIPGM